MDNVPYDKSRRFGSSREVWAEKRRRGPGPSGYDQVEHKRVAVAFVGDVEGDLPPSFHEGSHSFHDVDASFQGLHGLTA